MHQQPTFPADLLRLIRKEFNKILCQALERRQRVQWTVFKSLRKALATGNFRPDLVALPGRLAPLEPPPPPPPLNPPPTPLPGVN